MAIFEGGFFRGTFFLSRGTPFSPSGTFVSFLSLIAILKEQRKCLGKFALFLSFSTF